jgi:5'(3')-deoxyribonucleotidase/uncharacterized protein with PQ loop repeat
MSLEFWIALTGGAAAVATTVAFVPQAFKTWRQGGSGLSYGMLILYLTGIVLWLVYGVLIDARAVILANIASTVLVSLTLFLKYLKEGTRPQRERLRVAIDMDEVIADAFGKYRRTVDEVIGAALERRRLEGRSFDEVIPPEELDAARRLLEDPGFFRDLEVIEGSREVIGELAMRYEVYIASSAMEVPSSFAAKYAWLRENFPFIPPSHMVFCGDKSILNVDYLIDDSPRHFERFRGTPLLFSAPHNVAERRFRRVANWKEVREHLLAGEPALGEAAPSRVTSG